MIYLIDDKKLRQEKDYNWSDLQFEKYDKFIQPIYTLQELQARTKEVFQEGNIILYHESFLDKTDINTQASIRRDKLEKFSKNKSSHLVFFSGSKTSRKIKDGIANIPVSVLYQNIEEFIIKYSEDNINLKYLLFGKNPEIEEELFLKLQEVVNKTNIESPVQIEGNNLLIRTAKNNIDNPIEGADEKILFNDVSEKNLSEKTKDWLYETVYDSIFIPLCFGPILSDYNGLRLATHIRCTRTKNQTSRIFIYSFVGLDYLLCNKYFNILKTKNVQLIDFSKKVFEEVGNRSFEELKLEELPKEIFKIKLDPPKNYSDNHSIANEWAIYKWANAIGADDEGIGKVLKTVNYNLYFKYLQTIFPISKMGCIRGEELKIKGIDKAKILYIDDEAGKGWLEIFCTILADINGVIAFDYISEELKDKTQEEIITLSLSRIKEQSSDIVILDFRLHENDFSEKDINLITGLRILKKIKKINPGIQVIIFSATNKAWNLQAIQDAGADGFIMKESPENSVDFKFTRKMIMSFVKTLNTSSKRIYLKAIWLKLKELRETRMEYDSDISIAFKLLYDSINSKKYRNYAYLQLFLIVEKFISDTNIFIKNESGQNYVIGQGGKEILVFDYLRTENNNPIYKSAIKFSGGNYKKANDNDFRRRLDTNAIISALLIFRYGQDTSGEKKWTNIYTIRNKKAAHPEKGIVEDQELIILIDFLIFIIDDRNINNQNEKYGLETPTFEEQINRLEERFRN